MISLPLIAPYFRGYSETRQGNGVGMQEVHGCKEHILFEDMISTTEVLLRVLTT